MQEDAPQPKPMVYWLGHAAKELREQKDLLEVDVAALARVNQSTIGRFERGRGWPRDTEVMVNAYSKALGMRRCDIWLHAIQKMCEDDRLSPDEHSAA